MLALILIADLLLSARIFFIPHYTGDQCMYVCLAMKLGHFGMASYNLRQVAFAPRGPFMVYTNSSEGQQLLGWLAPPEARRITTNLCSTNLRCFL